MQPNTAGEASRNIEPIFAIRKTAESGQGMFAISKISIGTLIHTEKPTIKTSCMEVTALELTIKLQQLQQPTRTAFLALHNNFPARGIGGIVHTNGFRIRHSEDRLEAYVGEVAVYTKAARINHACLPNAQHSIDPVSGEILIFATQEISTGDEITINYTHLFLTKDLRQVVLRRDYGFVCKCILCARDNLDTFADDLCMDFIRAAITKLEQNPTLLQNSEMALEMIHEAIKRCREVGFTEGEAIAGLYSQAAVAMHYRIFSNVSGAASLPLQRKEYLPRLACLVWVAYKKLKDSLGSNATTTCLRRKELGRLELANALKEIPYEMPAAQFEEWLWEMEQ
ncbi:hypothetical protein BHYA_0414g00050 [Botrytis hyacinthi]|uniref:SET domain-containing protein n=1 Tax=Botrytis hyacinthi TaxID=278943 RepID=A0A4Z1G731_9HELO|nr:hypothetical protein BHYA_0414g00050 [Botrytis hyacinthi]